MSVSVLLDNLRGGRGKISVSSLPINYLTGMFSSFFGNISFDAISCSSRKYLFRSSRDDRSTHEIIEPTNSIYNVFSYIFFSLSLSTENKYGLTGKYFTSGKQTTTICRRKTLDSRRHCNTQQW